MAQIFVSHSQHDLDYVSLFAKAGAGTKVQMKFEEIEKIAGNSTSSDVIKVDIEQSKCIFVVLSRRVQDYPHTRDWVVWESGVASNRDIWIFEPFPEYGSISVVIPRLLHYVVFNTIDAHLAYIRRIIESYDDSHVLGALATGAGAGAAIASGAGAVVGAIASLILSDRSKQRPMGLQIQCGMCHSTYHIHLPEGMMIWRCPICNTTITMPGVR